MNDRIRDEYELEFSSKGSERVAGQLDRLQSTLDDLRRSGELSEKGLTKLSQATQRISSGLGSSSSAVKRYSDSFAQLRKEASQAGDAVQKAAQNYVGRGGTNPLGYSANNMSLADAQKYDAINRASNLTLQQAAQERLRLQERLNASKTQEAATDRSLANLGRDKTTVARENVALAQKELQLANQQRSALGAQGGRRGGGAATIADEVSAQERVAGAKRNVLSAQRELNAALDEGTQSTAGLRYANYDLASTLLITSGAITGLGVVTASAFADLESGFSAVERTSGLYGAAVEPLRNELLELSRVLPVTTEELQQFAARGAQLGIAQDSIAGFTETIAKFVATSPEVDINSVAEAFGRISNLTGEDDFEAIASSIAQVGVNAAATDQQIIKTTQEIARATAATTLSASEVIGLSAAFASLGVAPEAARGIFNQFFVQLDKGAAGLNDSLSVAAQILGTTEEAARDLYATDSGEFFQQFVDGLAGVENIAEALNALGTEGNRLTPAFTALARDSRENAAGQSVLASALRDANQGFAERTELERQYAPIADDLKSRLVLLVNAFKELAYSVGLELAPALKAGVDGLTELVQGVTDFINSPFGATVTRIVASLATLVAAYTGLRGGIALATATTEALRYVTMSLGGSSVLTGLTGLRNSIAGIGTASTVSAGGVSTLNGALATTGTTAAGAAAGSSSLSSNLGKVAKGGGIVGGILLIASAFTDLRGTVLSVIDAQIWMSENLTGLTNVLNAPLALVFGLAEAFGVLDTEALKTASGTVTFANTFSEVGNVVQSVGFVLANGFISLVNTIRSWAQSAAKYATIFAAIFGSVARNVIGSLSSIANAIADFLGPFAKGFSNGLEIFSNLQTESLKGLRSLAERLPGAAKQLDSFGGAGFDAGLAMGDVADATNDFSDAAGGAGDAAEEAAKKIYTLTDYANDLSSVWERAFDIRFSGQQSLDTIQNSLQKLRDAAAESAKRVLDLRTSIGSLQAGISTLKSDIGILEYYLKIAREYGDTKRATALEAELAEKRAELAEKTGELAGKSQELKNEQNSQSKSLVGSSQAARDNRAAILDLVAQYQAHIQKLAESGLSQDQLARETQRLKQDFIAQATQLGYNRAELSRYARAFDDVTVAINNVPRNITVTAHVNPAIQALNEFKARAEQANNAMQNLRNTAAQGIPSAGFGNAAAGAGAAAVKAEALAKVLQLAALTADAILNRNFVAAGAYIAQSAYWRARAQNGYAEGGFTGQGGMYEPAGTVHRGEYVIPKRDVNQSTGLPYADALGRMMNGAPSRTVAPAASSQSAGVTTVALSAGTIQAIAQATGKAIYLDGRMIADASANVYAQQNTVGAY